MRTTVPKRRLGTPFQRPAWRYDALRNPEKYGFRSFHSRQAEHAGCLRRIIKRGLDHRVTYVLPDAVRRFASSLPPHLAEQLRKVWHNGWRRRRVRKILIPDLDQYENLTSWNLRKIANCPDDWLKKLLQHASGAVFHSDIDAAVKLHLSDEYAQIKRYIGHLIFAKVPDADIAKEWFMPPSVITALRMLFFDFSALPSSPVAQWATLVQWVNNGDIKPDEFALYRRVHEMGPLGLKAQVAGAFLTDPERLEVRDYLSNTALSNTFNIQFSTRTPRDALIYNKVIGDLVRMDLQREELNLRKQEQKLLEMQVKKISRELEDNRAREIQSEDMRLIQEAISSLGKKDDNPEYRSVFDLNEIK